jgi:hypothetical protein
MIVRDFPVKDARIRGEFQRGVVILPGNAMVTKIVTGFA